MISTYEVCINKPTFFLFIKNNKQSQNNYRPASLLPICKLIFKRLLYSNMVSFFIENVWYLKINVVFNRRTTALTKFCQLLIKSIRFFNDRSDDDVWHQSVILKLKWNIKKFTEDHWRHSCKKVPKSSS